MKKKVAALLIAAVMIIALCGCEDMEIGKPIEADPAAPSPSYAPQSEHIQLNGNTASYSGSGVTVRGNTVTVSAPGEYTVKGELTGGQIIVNIGEIPGKVTLILDGVTMTNDTEPCIFAEQGKTIIALTDGSVNSITTGDPNSFTPASDAATGGAIYGKDDLSVQGNGSLSVIGAVNNGIASKNDLKINCGSLSVTAANNGLKGKDSVSIDGGDISITALNDGIKATNIDRADKGFVKVNGGSVSVTASGDGISASTGFELNGGDVRIICGAAGSITSCKAVKAATGLDITGGSLYATAYDHVLHCDADINIAGGTLTLESLTAKGISAHGNINITDGAISVSSRSDGIEAKKNMTVSGGSISVSSDGDGFNVGSAGNNNGFATGEYGFTMNGGSVFISSGEDGIDSNGDLVINGGELVIDGPTTGGDDALDWSYEANKSGIINGGTVFAVHVPGMIQSISADSAQGFICASLGGFAPAGSTVTIKDASGNVIYTGNCAKTFGYVIFSSADVVKGEVYTVTAGSLSAEATAGVTIAGGDPKAPGMGGPGNGQPPAGDPGGMPPRP